MPTDTLIPNAIVLTNWVTQTNAISAWNDPQLWFTGLGIIISCYLIYRQVAIMKKQAKISEKQLEISKLHITDAKINELMSIFIDINRQYNESLFHICKLRNGTHPALALYDPHPKKVIPYYFNLSLFLNLACRIYYQQESSLRKKITKNFKNIFDKDIIQFFKEYDSNTMSEYKALKDNFDPINIESLEQYYKESLGKDAPNDPPPNRAD